MGFNRPPRRFSTFSPGKIDLSIPGDIPSEPSINWISITVSLAGLGLILLLMNLSSSTTNFSSFFLIFMVLGVTGTVATFFYQRNIYKNKLSQLQRKYEAHLSKQESELVALIKTEKDNGDFYYPNLTNCLDLTSTQSNRLGERRPSDEDFLGFRVGLGLVESQFVVETPQSVEESHPMFELTTEAQRLKTKYSKIADYPISLNLQELALLGVVGELSIVQRLVQSIVCNVATFHWPTEVNFLLFSPQRNHQSWRFLGMLPHRGTWDRSNISSYIDANLVEVEKEITRRSKFLNNSEDEKNFLHKFNLPALIIIFDDFDANKVTDASILSIINKGPNLGIFSIFCSRTVSELPNPCRGEIVIENNRVDIFVDGQLINNGSKIEISDVGQVDPIDFAKNLVGIDWISINESSIAPTLVSLFDIFNVHSAADLPVEEMWAGQFESKEFGYLKAPIGKLSGRNKLFLDLNESDEAHGPHGFIGGTTGSGKSELLKTFVLSFAITHSPKDLTFALIDFKGGATFDDLANLPHVRGVITDIETHAQYAGRVIKSLTGEVNYRKTLFRDFQSINKKNISHIDQYRELPVKIPLSRLIIIFDEFAEFKDRHPDESRDLISIARVGRSLGIHLVISTQNPIAAIDNQVKQNSRFRISLGLNSAEDSKELIGIADAYNLPTGRAYFKIDTPVLFQVGYSKVFHDLGSNRVSEFELTIDQILQTQERASIPEVRAVWKDPIDDILPLDQVYKGHGIKKAWQEETWGGEQDKQTELILGKIDNPSFQEQPVLQFGDENPVLTIIGNPGSGKSMAIISAVFDLVSRFSPEEANYYSIEFDSKKQLSILQDFPHTPEVGGFCTINEPERIYRLFAYLKHEVTRRADLFRNTNSNNLKEYNSRAGLKGSIEPIIYLFIDGYTKDIDIQIPGFSDQLQAIISESRSVGIRVLITTSRLSNVPTALFDLVPFRIALRQSEKPLYASIVGRVDQQLLTSPIGEVKSPGWGVVNTTPPLEIKLACPSSNPELVNQDIKGLAKAMKNSWAEKNRPKNIYMLPSIVNSRELVGGGQKSGKSIEQSQFNLPVAISQESLQPVNLSLLMDGPVFLVSSTESRLGKTTFIKTWLSELLRNMDQDLLSIDVMDHHKREYGDYFSETNVIGLRSEYEEFLIAAKEDILRRREFLEGQYQNSPRNFDLNTLIATKELGIRLIVIDNFNAFANSQPDLSLLELEKILEDGIEVGYRVMVAERVSLITRHAKVINKAVRYGSGILFGGADGIDLFNNAKIPFSEKQKFSIPGRGYLIKNGTVRVVQAFSQLHTN